jgi:hypothetical protein
MLGGSADVKVQTFNPSQQPPFNFQSGTLVPFALSFGEAKHNNGPDVAQVDVAWKVEKTAGEPFVGFRWAAQPGDVCTLNGTFKPCGEGDTPGQPSVSGDNCFDGIDNDDNGTADLFGTGPTAPDPNLPFDPQCAHFINDLHFTIELPVSSVVNLDRELSIQCNSPGTFQFRAENLEEVLPPWVDPEPANNNEEFNGQASCQP